MLRNIGLFFSAGKGRETNDSANRIRETILTSLLHPPEDYFIDEEYGQHWVTMSTKWSQFLKTLCPHEYTDIRIKKIANLSNHDLLIEYMNNTQIVHTIFGEFKHNASSISKLPEYYNAPEKKGFIPVKYSEYFYDTYIDRLCELTNVEKLDKESYMKHIYQTKYSVNMFFQKLKDAEDRIYKEKQKLVRESIKTYLETYAFTLSLENVTRDIMVQKDKTFILWDCNEFRADKIQPDELELIQIERIKNDNTIVVLSKAGTRHHMLLRWKNHLGILYPAWQISLQR